MIRTEQAKAVAHKIAEYKYSKDSAENVIYYLSIFDFVMESATNVACYLNGMPLVLDERRDSENKLINVIVSFNN